MTSREIKYHYPQGIRSRKTKYHFRKDAPDNDINLFVKEVISLMGKPIEGYCGIVHPKRYRIYRTKFNKCRYKEIPTKPVKPVDFQD